MFNYTCLRCKKEFQSPKKDKKYCSHYCYGKRFAPVDLRCEVCEKQFTVAYRFRNQITCGVECAGKRTSHLLSRPVHKQCNWCDKDYTTVPNAAETSKFCSQECFHLHLRDGNGKFVTLTCEACQKEYEKAFIRRDSRFCSRSCATSGERNAQFGLGKNAAWNKVPRWHKGLTKETDERLARQAEKMSEIIAQKIVNGECTHPNGFEAGWFESQKCGTRMFYRSSYERRFLEMLEVDADVVSFETEPFRIPYMFEGEKKNYVPDVLVKRASKTQLVEIKPEKLLSDAKVVAKQNAAMQWCQASGVEYVSVAEEGLA